MKSITSAIARYFRNQQASAYASMADSDSTDFDLFAAIMTSDYGQQS
jgi:hypothetical protein